jgi:hypothetical protein
MFSAETAIKIYLRNKCQKNSDQIKVTVRESQKSQYHRTPLRASTWATEALVDPSSAHTSLSTKQEVTQSREGKNKIMSDSHLTVLLRDRLALTDGDRCHQRGTPLVGKASLFRARNAHGTPAWRIDSIGRFGEWGGLVCSWRMGLPQVTCLETFGNFFWYFWKLFQILSCVKSNRVLIF